MAQFVHLTSEKNAAAIRRSGIKARDLGADLGCGVYAMPVVPDFSVSHQWLRELKRGGQRTICGVYFRIPDEQPVHVGHYASPPREMSAAEAVGVVMAQESAEGYEVTVPRRIEATEVFRVRHLPQVVGWRYAPGVRGMWSGCGCPVCVPPGGINARKKRERWEAEEGGDV